MQLLVVEDYHDCARLFSLLLKNLGDVDVAMNVDDALDKARSTRYDLCVVDIQLGEKRTGVDLLHALRSDPRYATVPIIACTAYVQPEERTKVMNHGFNGFVGKPFTKAQLVEEINRHLPA